jgi:hypothetical protein
MGLIVSTVLLFWFMGLYSFFGLGTEDVSLMETEMVITKPIRRMQLSPLNNISP